MSTALKGPYTTQLGAGCGMVDATITLLETWQPDHSASNLLDVTMGQGTLGSMTARRQRNIIKEMFATRYLSDAPPAARWLKPLTSQMPRSDLSALFLVYTARANEIFHDFLTEVYWPSYAAGRQDLDTYLAQDFIRQAGQAGIIEPMWSDSMVKRVGAYLLSCCADYGLLEPGRKSKRAITPASLSTRAALYLVHELHFQGINDNSVLHHRDWGLFGLEVPDVLELFKRLVAQDHFLLQYSGDLLRISWKHQNMEEVIDAILGE